MQEKKLLVQGCGTVFFLLVIWNSKAGPCQNKALLHGGKTLCIPEPCACWPGCTVSCCQALGPWMLKSHCAVGAELWQAGLPLQWVFNAASATMKQFCRLVNWWWVQGRPYQVSAAMAPRNLNTPFLFPFASYSSTAVFHVDASPQQLPHSLSEAFLLLSVPWV